MTLVINSVEVSRETAKKVYFSLHRANRVGGQVEDPDVSVLREYDLISNLPSCGYVLSGIGRVVYEALAKVFEQREAEK